MIVMISLTLHPEEEVRTPKGRMLHQWRKESPRTRAIGSNQEWTLSAWKTAMESNPPLLLSRTTPIPTSLTIQKRRSQSTKIRVDLARSEIRRVDQVKTRALITFPDIRILSRKLIFCDKISRRLMYCANRLHHHHLSPSPSFFG